MLAAGYPQAWSEEELADLWDTVPLARWIVIQTGWTRSALRHLPLFPAACTVPRERFAIRLRQEIEVLAGRGTPLPLTASLDETFLRDAELPRIDLNGLRVGIQTPDADLRSWLREFLTWASAELVTLDRRPAAVLWDLDPWNEDRKAQLETFRRGDPCCYLVGVRNTLHELALREADQYGIDSLVPKSLGARQFLELLATCKVT
jgi:hypothetical protein